MLFCVFAIVYPLSDYIAKSRVITVIGLAAISYALGFVVSYISKGIFQIGTSFSYLPYFLIGFLFRKYWSNIKNKKLTAVAMGGGFMNIMLFTFLQGIMVPHVTGMIATFLTLLCKLSGTIGVFCLLLVLFRKIRSASLLNRLSAYSFPIYLFHQQIIYVVIVMLNGVVEPFIISFVSFFASVVISILITMILARWEVTRSFIGIK